MNHASKPSVFVFYHYLPPDDVVSAVHYGDLCAGLAERGWDVTAFPTVWACRDHELRFPAEDVLRGVRIRRLWRPRFRQSSGLGRLLNAAWMIARWSFLALSTRNQPDILIIGTDPVLSVLVARFWKRMRPRTKIVHWCFDLYPEAAVADGLLREEGAFAQLLYKMLRPAYQACSVIVDIGSCMRVLLNKYGSHAKRVTLVPWAIEEADAPLAIDQRERQEVFGRARLALLYSGSFGRAHSYNEILQLIENLSPQGAKLAFSVRGNRESELRKAAAKHGEEIRFVDFAKEDRLAARLSCADVHVVSLQPEWTGMVVPSKFFGALSAGRPVLFAGSRESSIARWIEAYNVGWVLNTENLTETVQQLRNYADSPQEQSAMQHRCFDAYQQNFSKRTQFEQWHQLLQSLLPPSPL